MQSKDLECNEHREKMQHPTENQTIPEKRSPSANSLCKNRLQAGLKELILEAEQQVAQKLKQEVSEPRQNTDWCLLRSEAQQQQ